MKIPAIALIAIGVIYVSYINTLDEKRMEAYNGCSMVEDINGDYQCISK